MERLVSHKSQGQSFSTFAPPIGQNFAPPDRGFSRPKSVGALPSQIFGLVRSLHDLFSLKIPNSLFLKRLQAYCEIWRKSVLDYFIGILPCQGRIMTFPDIILKEGSNQAEMSCIYLITREFLNYFVYKALSFVIIR